jgi:biotin transporter BioY
MTRQHLYSGSTKAGFLAGYFIKALVTASVIVRRGTKRRVAKTFAGTLLKCCVSLRQ